MVSTYKYKFTGLPLSDSVFANAEKDVEGVDRSLYVSNTGNGAMYYFVLNNRKTIFVSNYVQQQGTCDNVILLILNVFFS